MDGMCVGAARMPVSVSVSPEHILSHPHKGHCGTQAIALRVKCAGTPSMVRSSVAELPLRWQCRYRLQPTFQHLPVFGFVTEDRRWIKLWPFANWCFHGPVSSLPITNPDRRSPQPITFVAFVRDIFSFPEVIS